MKPFNYEHIASFYDEMEVNPRLNDIIVLNLSRIFSSRSVKKVWDAACGTGCQALPLAAMGFEVIATDIAGTMIEKALEKPGAEKVDFEVADLVSFQIKADAAIAMTNVLLHFNAVSILEAFANIAANLESGGLFIADFDNRLFIEKSGEVLEGYYEAGEGEVAGVKAKRMTRASDLGNGMYRMEDRWSVGEEVLYETEWDLKSWYMEEITKLLEQAGFKVLNWYTRAFQKVVPQNRASFDSLLFVAEKE